ncbi:hypothetical protein [Roseofilum casamattae]|uniref:CorA-like Mg2+ transporter protein n=1 Tax=Roseofilum casamattae BLCC-M143 TaxID=3022442 RepID=A0ABT7BZN5_9CYAN|nr:hypothetical protein [Roseofilum casamattae]MDJ1183728.1 hypothetical protein [Roseofilum casamattae BLCC-M143]
MTDLFYPNLDVFVYSLREGLGYSNSDIQENQRLFWQLLPEELQEQRETSFTQEENTATPHYLELLELNESREPVRHFKQEKQEHSESPPIQGYYYPVRLWDTYGLMLDCYLANAEPIATANVFPETEHFPGKSSIQRLNNYAQKILDRANTSTTYTSELYLGKTWIVSGGVSSNTNLENLVNELCQGLELGNIDSKHCQWGEFLGVDCCEVYQQPPQWKERDKEIHVLFFFFPNLEKFGEFSGFYKTWMELFHYHHKMNWAYWQTRDLKRKMMAGYGESFAIAKTLRDLSLSQLEEKLQKTTETLSDYVDNLSYLGIQPHTIKTNLTNYQSCLQELQKKSQTDLPFLAKFSDNVKKKYLPQIERDRQSLSQGLRVLENLLQSIRSKIQLEQTKSDRELNETLKVLQVFGAGLAVSSITATLVSTQVKEPTRSPAPELPGWPFWYAILWTVVMGCFATIGVVLGFKRKRKK